MPANKPLTTIPAYLTNLQQHVHGAFSDWLEKPANWNQYWLRLTRLFLATFFAILIPTNQIIATGIILFVAWILISQIKNHLPRLITLTIITTSIAWLHSLMRLLTA